MKFVNYIKYIQDEDKVARLRPSHRQYMAKLLAEGKLVAAGPFADGSGALFIYETETKQAAEALATDDPYVEGGAFASYEITPWAPVSINVDLLRLT